MDMNKPSPTRDKRLAPLVQAGLAALVAGSLLMFSAIAFRTGFLDDTDGGVRAAAAGTASARPVVLPAATQEPEVVSRRQSGAASESITVAELAPGADAVLGTKVKGSERSTERASARADADRHKRERGDGHDKARGKGHHRADDDRSSHSREGDARRTLDEAKEDDDNDDDRDGHDRDDEDDDSDHSRRSSGASHGHAKRHKDRGSKHHKDRGSKHHGNGGSSRSCH